MLGSGLRVAGGVVRFPAHRGEACDAWATRRFLTVRAGQVEGRLGYGGAMATSVWAGDSKHTASGCLCSDGQIQQIAQGSADSIADWIRSTASERGIHPHRGAVDIFADAVSRLSDAAVDLDAVEETLIALRGAGVITSFQRGLLQVGYLR